MKSCFIHTSASDSDYLYPSYFKRVMNEEVEEMERNINNITFDTPFQSPGTKSVQKKYASWSLERQLASFFCTLLVLVEEYRK